MTSRVGLLAAFAALTVVLVATPAGAQTPPPRQTPPPPPGQAPPPVPKPFPGAATPRSTTDKNRTRTGPASGQAASRQAAPGQAAAPAEVQAAGQEPAPSEQVLGAPVYPGAVFLESFDAGSNQRFYLFGTNAPFDDIVQYYKNVLRTGGRELFKAPATRQFDIAKFHDDTMAFQPSVVVKDYTWHGQEGYLFVSGTSEQRYRTVIQIVPPPGS